MAAEPPLKIVFDNLRNLLACITLATLAAAACRFHQHLALASWATYSLAGVLFIFTGCLAAADAWAGCRELMRERHWLHLLVLGGIYLALLVLLGHALPTLSRGGAGP